MAFGVSRFSSGLFALGLAVVVGVAGCKQAAGERCQLDSDCEDGFICRYVGMPNPAEGGQCQSSQSNSDAAPLPDAAVDGATDGSSDAADAASDAAPDASPDAAGDAAVDAAPDA